MRLLDVMLNALVAGESNPCRLFFSSIFKTFEPFALLCFMISVSRILYVLRFTHYSTSSATISDQSSNTLRLVEKVEWWVVRHSRSVCHDRLLPRWRKRTGTDQNRIERNRAVALNDAGRTDACTNSKSENKEDSLATHQCQTRTT